MRKLSLKSRRKRCARSTPEAEADELERPLPQEGARGAGGNSGRWEAQAAPRAAEPRHVPLLTARDLLTAAAARGITSEKPPEILLFGKARAQLTERDSPATSSPQNNFTPPGSLGPALPSPQLAHGAGEDQGETVSPGAARTDGTAASWGSSTQSLSGHVETSALGARKSAFQCCLSSRCALNVYILRVSAPAPEFLFFL